MTYCTKNQAAQLVATSITAFADDKVTLLLSGGSSAAVGAMALSLVDNQYRQNISVMLADERYVPYGSSNSNATLLKKLGVPKLCSSFTEVLTFANDSRHQVTANYRQHLGEAVQQKSTIIALFGIGVDNHIAGILPGSPAATAHDLYVTDYTSNVFERITITPPFFNNITAAFVYAEGTDKDQAIHQVEQDKDVVMYPSQLVKKTKNWQLLFNKESI